MATQPAQNRQQRSPRGTFSALSHSPILSTAAMEVPSRSASTSSLAYSSESSSHSPRTPPTLATTIPSQPPPEAGLATDTRSNTNDSQGTRPLSRKAASLYTDLSGQAQTAEVKQEASTSRNPFRFTQAPKQKTRTLRPGDIQGDIHSIVLLH